MAERGSDQNASPNHAFACEGILSHRGLGQKMELIPVHVRYIASGNLLYASRNSNQSSDDLGRWDGVGPVREVQEGGGMCILMADAC